MIGISKNRGIIYNKMFVLIVTLLVVLVAIYSISSLNEMSKINRDQAVKFYVESYAASLDLTSAFHETVTINTTTPKFNSSFEFKGHMLRGRGSGFEHTFHGRKTRLFFYRTFYMPYLKRTSAIKTENNERKKLIIKDGDIEVVD